MGPLSWELVRWPAARISAPDQGARTRLLVFVAAEVVLALAIPFMLIRGYHTLLSSNTGTFVDTPTIDEPGWSALVSSTTLTAVIEVVDGGVTGAALLVPGGPTSVEPRADSVPAAGSDKALGTVVLIPGDLSLPADVSPNPATGVAAPARLSGAAPSSAGEALAALLNVDLAAIQVMDEAGWSEALAGTTYELDNPDPVPATSDPGGEPDQLAFAVGPVKVDGADAAIFLGRPVDGGTLSSVTLRRHQFWSTLLNTPPAADHPLAETIRSLGDDDGARIVELPTIATAGAVVVDETAAERLLRDIVAFPSGNRLEVRLVDRTGDADLTTVAAQLAGRGIEVVEIANAVRFDDGSTEVIRPPEFADGIEQFDDLVAELGVQPIVDIDEEHDTVTLLVGRDLGLSG